MANKEKPLSLALVVLGSTMVAGVLMNTTPILKALCVGIGFTLMIWGTNELLTIKKGKSFLILFLCVLAIGLTFYIFIIFNKVYENCKVLSTFIDRSRKIRSEFIGYQNAGVLTDQRMKQFLVEKNDYYSQAKRYIEDNLDKDDFLNFSTCTDEAATNRLYSDFSQSISCLKNDESILQEMITELKRKE